MGQARQPTQSKWRELSSHQVALIACAGLVRMLRQMEAVPRTQPLLTMLSRAIEDGSEAAVTLAIGLIASGAVACEASLLESGKPSMLEKWERVLAAHETAERGQLDA